MNSILSFINKITVFSILIISTACGQSTDTDTPSSSSKVDTSFNEGIPSNKPEEFIPKTIIDNTTNTFAWLDNYDVKNALLNRVPVPKGYQRVTTSTGTFSNWLQFLPLESSGAKVYYYNGEPKYTQQVHEAVIKIDVGKRDLQQCADAVMRLKAEYHYSLDDWEAIHFNYTSGHKVSFDDWRYGKKPRISGNNVSFTAKGSTSNTTYSNFKKYLISIYSYAGTASLSKEMQPVSVQNMQIGDVFIQGGFPGHAVIVVDMAENKAGEKIFLIAQSYMPAQSIHILKNYHYNNEKLGAWYPLDFGQTLHTPEWEFTKNDLKRFE